MKNANKHTHRGLKITLIIIATILGLIIVSSSVIAIVSKVGSDALLTAVSKVDNVHYNGETIAPVLDETSGKAQIDEDGFFTFFDSKGLLDTRNFRVLQITDVHIGAGAFSMRTDAWTIKTVEDLISRVQPDLVVVTGDIAYPVPFQAGSMNNKNSAKIFADLMENLGVYWTLSFGNHDTEAYSYYNREQIGKLYASDKYRHCLFNNEIRTLKDGQSVFGIGNFAINVKDKNGELVHTMFMFDSNAYLPEDPLGLQWKYDRIHDDQIKWYEETAERLGLSENGSVKSTAYFHIPLYDYVATVDEWNKTGNSDKIELRDGVMGEYISGGTKVKSRILDAFMAHGTNGTFCGHDHQNNASYLLDRDGIGKGRMGMRLTYGMSIDYLAYSGIYKKTQQRGGRMIEINSLANLVMQDDIDTTEYDTTHFAEDKPFGFFTYHVPYWNDLYRGVIR